MARQIQILPSEDENVLGKSLLGAVQGFTQGKEMKRKQYEQSLADAKTFAEIQELQRKTQSLNEPAPKDYFRDAYSGRLMPTDPYRGRGTTVNLPFQFDSGQKDDGDVFGSPEEADGAGLQPGTTVMVINPATGQPEEYEI